MHPGQRLCFLGLMGSVVQQQQGGSHICSGDMARLLGPRRGSQEISKAKMGDHAETHSGQASSAHRSFKPYRRTAEFFSGSEDAPTSSVLVDMAVSRELAFKGVAE